MITFKILSCGFLTVTATFLRRGKVKLLQNELHCLAHIHGNFHQDINQVYLLYKFCYHSKEHDDVKGRECNFAAAYNVEVVNLGDGFHAPL